MKIITGICTNPDGWLLLLMQHNLQSSCPLFWLISPPISYFLYLWIISYIEIVVMFLQHTVAEAWYLLSPSSHSFKALPCNPCNQSLHLSLLLTSLLFTESTSCMWGGVILCAGWWSNCVIKGLWWGYWWEDGNKSLERLPCFACSVCLHLCMCVWGSMSDLSHLHNWWLWAGERLHQGHRAHLKEKMERERVMGVKTRGEQGQIGVKEGGECSACTQVDRKQSGEGCIETARSWRGEREPTNRGTNNGDKTGDGEEGCLDCRWRQWERAGERSRKAWEKPEEGTRGSSYLSTITRE